jgi:flagellar protein FlaF
MYRHAYAEIAEDATPKVRGEERKAFAILLQLLETASASPVGSGERLEAAKRLSDVWSKILEDISDDDNSLPVDLRAQLGSIGIFMLKEAFAIADGSSEALTDVIEIHRNVMEGLA